MGDFCFWPKETMYQQLRFHFDFILSRFYLFLNIAGRFFIMGIAFQWFGRSLGHSSTLLLYDGTASFLFWFVRKLAIADFFRKLSWSIFIVCQEVRLHSPLNEEENRDLISPVQMPVEFQTLFSIIKASTAN